jgi:hypothetical protein
MTPAATEAALDALPGPATTSAGPAGASEPERPTQPILGAPSPIAGMGALLPERTAEDILEGVVRLRFGRPPTEYAVPVLSIAANRRWKAGLEAGLTGMLDAVEQAGDDMGAIMMAFSAASPQMLDALYVYDAAGVLPPRAELEEVATDMEVLLATLEVWTVANPFAELALGIMRGPAQVRLPSLETPEPPSSPPTSGSRAATGGRPPASKRT